MLRHLVGPAILAGLVCLTALADTEPAGKKYASPQEVFKAASDAAENKDWKAVYGCLTKESGENLAGQMAFLGLLMRGFAELDKTGKTKEKLKPIEEVYEKHGLTKEALDKMKGDAPKPSKDPKEQAKALRMIVRPVKDKAAFLSDLMKALEDANPKSKGKNLLEGAKLKDVKIDGDKATATVVKKEGDKEKEEPLAFHKEGGSWKIELPLPKPAETKPKDKDKAAEKKP